MIYNNCNFCCLFLYSVVTSVSVILNGDEPEFTDALGHKVPRPQPGLQLASPIDLLNPDRYEFYTFDDNGELVKRLMTLQEIQSIVANGDGDGPNIINSQPIVENDPQKNMQDILFSVQNVLNKHVDNKTNNELMPVLDTPDVSSSWSMILPAIFGNTGGDIYPQQKPQQIVMTPDSELLESDTKETTNGDTTKKPKPNKRKPGQKRKPTPSQISTTTKTTPQVVQEELEPHESVYTGIQQYQNMATHVQDFETFSHIHMQPIYHKFPESTTRRVIVNNQELHIKPITNDTSIKKTSATTNKRTSPNRKNGNNKRPRPGQKKPALNHTSSGPKRPKPTTTTTTTSTTSTTAAPTTTSTTMETTSTTIETTESTTASTPINPETSITSTTSGAPTTIKKKKNKPTRAPTTVSDIITQAKPQTTKRKPTTSTKTKPTTQLDKTKKKPVIQPANPSETETQSSVQKTHRHRPKPYKTTTTPLYASPVPTTSTPGTLIVENFPGLSESLKNNQGTKTSSIKPTPSSVTTTLRPGYAPRPSFVSPGYPVPAYGLEKQDDRISEAAEQITINQLNKQPIPSLSLVQQQYQTPLDDTSPDQSQTEDNLKLSFGQIVQSLKQETSSVSNVPLGYDSAESLDKLEQMANKKKKPYISTSKDEKPTELINENVEKPVENLKKPESVEQIVKTELPIELLIATEIPKKTTIADEKNEILLNNTNTNKKPVAQTEANAIEIEALEESINTDIDITKTPIDDTKDVDNYKSTTESVELEQTTEEIVNIKDENLGERLPVTLAQQIEILMEHDLPDATTIPPPSVVDLNAQFNLNMLQPTDPISMSDFQTQAATIASHIIDIPKVETNMGANETKNEIDLIMSDNMDHINKQNPDKGHRLTNFAQFNTSFLFKPPIDTNILASSTEQEINRILANLLHKLPYENEFENNNNNNNNTDITSEVTSTTLSYLQGNAEDINDYTLKTDSTTIYPIVTLENATDMSTEKEGNNSQSIFNKNNNNNNDDAGMLEENTKNSQELEITDDLKTVNSESMKIKPIKLNQNDEKAQLSSSIEEIKQLQLQEHNATEALEANSDEYISEDLTTINYATVQLQDTTENTELMQDNKEQEETESPNVMLEDSSTSITNIKVNDDATSQKEVHKQKIAAKIEDSVTGITKEVPLQYEFVTEATAEYEKQSTDLVVDDDGKNGGDDDDAITNPINSASQSTESVQILSEINNNLQEIMSPNMENGTETPVSLTSLTNDVDVDNKQDDEQSTEAIESTTIYEFNDVKEKSEETTTISMQDVDAEGLEVEQEQEEEEQEQELEEAEGGDLEQDVEENRTDSAIDEDPYIKLGETTISPLTIAINATNQEDVGPILNVLNASSTAATLLPSNVLSDMPTKGNKNLNNERDDDEDEADQTTINLTSTTTSNLLTSTLTTPKVSTTKRYNTLKPVSYYKQPAFGPLSQPEYPKPANYISAQQRPMQRPPALSNLMASSAQATRQPVKLEPSPNHSKGLEASTLNLDPDVLDFARLCNELAFNYWKSITSEKISSARSLVISPFALTSMLSMVFLGARGSTSGEMNEVLKLDDMVTFNPHLIFKNITDSVEAATDSDIATAAFVREIFSDRANGRVLQFFKEKTQQFYAGHVEEVNFNVVNDVIRRRTNLLVKRHTMGKVLEYLRTNSVWVNGPLATISANLFQTDCTRGSTTDRDGELFFQVNPTVRQRRLVPIPAVLYKTGFTAGYDSQLDATIVAFGRIQDTVSTIYVMPGHQSSATPVDNLDRMENELIERAFTKHAWSNLLTSLMDRPGLEVQLPRFSHRSFVNASLGLQKMGLEGLFKSDFADLRGLTGSSHRDVFLSDMIQINTFSTCGEERISDQHHVEMYPAPPLRKRNKDVDADDVNDNDNIDSSEAIIDFGSLVHESAIARSFYDDLLDPKYLELPLPLRPRQARVPDAPPRLRFDKPFLYFVRHNPTGIILFMGRFNPRLLP